MSLQRDVDVVVVGFGLRGAAAALEAANAGARVLALAGRPGAGELQTVACAAGVEVWAGAVAHELVVEDGRIAGVGYAVPRAAEDPTAEPWHATTVGCVTCSSVVLAVDARHWEFVGSAVWSVVRGRVAASHVTKRLAVVAADHLPQPAPADDPELTVRRWCAAREAGPAAAASQSGLRVEEPTGMVTTGEQWPVPGLYSAVPGGDADGDIRSVIAAARRVGRAAARTPAGRVTLSSVG